MGTLFTYHNISTLRGERERFPVISGKDWDILGCVCVCAGVISLFLTIRHTKFLSQKLENNIHAQSNAEFRNKNLLTIPQERRQKPPSKHKTTVICISSLSLFVV
jgi:hypothetical protein